MSQIYICVFVCVSIYRAFVVEVDRYSFFVACACLTRKKKQSVLSPDDFKQKDKT